MRTSNFRNIVLPVALVILTGVGLTSVVTGAVFADSKQVDGTSFVTGTVALGAAPVAAPLALSNMAPGDKVTAPIEVSNTGTLAERYAVLARTDAPSSDALAGQLVLTVKTGVSACTNAAFAADGTSVYSGALASTVGVKVVGDSAVGAQTGDRTLNAGAKETLCAQVSLPLATDRTFAGKTANASLVFNAEQVVNNP
jgi:hypothetical protein